MRFKGADTAYLPFLKFLWEKLRFCLENAFFYGIINMYDQVSK